MKIKKVSVKNLFGIFDHEIPLNTNEHITIIHGPNGYGKTILLTLLDAIFRSQYHELHRVPFNELKVEFDDESYISLTKKGNHSDAEGKSSSNGNRITFEYRKHREKPKSFPIEPLERDISFSLNNIERMIPHLRRIDELKWIDRSNEDILSFEEVLERYDNILPSHLKTFKEPEWFEKLKKSIAINFIETQRLLTISPPRSKYEYRGEPSVRPAVDNYSKELAGEIQKKLAEYGSTSQALDRTFPSRLVKGVHTNEPTIEELKNKLKGLEEKRSRLVDAGFIEKEKEIDFKDLQQIDKSNINVLSVYISDVTKKMEVFDELTDRIDLLVKIINNRFFFKQLSISRQDGFIFKTPSGKILPLRRLSSGEQHELVLLYEMLFKVKPDSLILIDEPELSLHVVWQQQFLKDLQEITKLAGFDVLIATHSPQIIFDRWDLTVELKGPQQ